MRHIRAARRAAAAALAATLATGCVGPDEPPDVQGDGVPVVGDDGAIVGTADADELAEVGESGSVDVYEDGDRVGSFSPSTGFTPIEDAP